jgi:hypothetical protein
VLVCIHQHLVAPPVTCVPCTVELDRRSIFFIFSFFIVYFLLGDVRVITTGHLWVLLQKKRGLKNDTIKNTISKQKNNHPFWGVLIIGY